MIDKKEIPLDKGTTILSQNSMVIGHLNSVMQTWILDGVRATSCIFRAKDVETLGYEELKQLLVKENFLNQDSHLTVSRNGDFTFVNFNFDY